MAILILAGKIVANKFIHIDNLSENYIGGLLDIFIYPAKSSASSLWYIYVLFIFYIIFPFTAKFLKAPILLTLACFGIYFISPYLSDMFMLNRVAEYLLFIVIGAIVAINYAVFCKQLDKVGIFILVLFTVLIGRH